jgi:DivIVA domain-containing protein
LEVHYSVEAESYDGWMALQNDHEFLPADVARAVFPTAFRGYDQEAVRRYLTRLAESLEHQLDLGGLEALAAHAPNQDRIEELEAEVLELQEQLGSMESDLAEAVALAEAATSEPPPLDEQQAIAWLGQETARVLESARSAAADITAKAETEAAALREEASSELTAAQEQAESVRSDAEAEAAARVESLTSEAEARAQSVVAEAESRAETVTTEADARAAEVTAEADAKAAKVTAEADAKAAEVTAEADAKAAEVTAEADAKAAEVTAEAEALAAEVTAEAEARSEEASTEAAATLAKAKQEAAALESDARSRAAQLTEFAEQRRRALLAGFVDERRRSHAEVGRLSKARTRLAEALREAQEQLDDVSADLEAAASTDLEVETVAEEPAEDEVQRLLDALDADLPDGPEPATAASEPAAESPMPDAEPGRSASVDEPTAEMRAVELPDKGRGGTGRRTTATPRKKPPAKKTTSKKTTAKASAAKQSASSKPAGKQSAGTKAAAKKPASTKAPSGDEARKVVVAAPAAQDAASSEADADRESGGPLAEDSSDKLASLVEGFTTIDVLTDLSLEATGGQPAATADEPSPGASAAGVAAPRPAVDPALLVPLVEVPDDPADRITTVAARTATGKPDGRRGDFALEDPTVDRLPAWFAARDAATSRGGPNLRRHIRRALNDDQSDVMDRLRNGRGPITVDELPPAGEQLDRFLAPITKALTDVIKAGARAAGGHDVAEPVIGNVCRQLAAHLVDQLRLPTVAIVAETDHDDRELILEPIRALYRDVRNIQMPDLADDALHEAFAIGFYDGIEPGSVVRWEIDPRTDPDPVCDINRDRQDLTKGEVFPSGHLRPLSLPGCRCLVVGAAMLDQG